LDPNQLSRVSLDRYTSIVLAGGRYDDLNDRTVEALRTWVQAGGSLITYGSASSWALSKGIAGKVQTASDPATADSKSDVRRRDFAERSAALGEQRTSGNAVSTDVDITHPLAFGIANRALSVNKETAVTLPS